MGSNQGQTVNSLWSNYLSVPESCFSTSVKLCSLFCPCHSFHLKTANLGATDSRMIWAAIEFSGPWVSDLCLAEPRNGFITLKALCTFPCIWKHILKTGVGITELHILTLEFSMHSQTCPSMKVDTQNSIPK